MFKLNSYEKSLEAVGKHLEDDEEVVESVWGMVSVGGAYNKPYILALTDKRLIRLGKGIFGGDVVNIPLDNIISISEASDWQAKGILFGLINGSIIFFPSRGKENSERMAKLVKYLKKRISRKGSDSSVNNDIPEQIRKLHELSKDGIISPEEFEDKKKDLLARI